MKRILSSLFVVALFTSATPWLTAQALDTRILHYADSALREIRMTRSDLAMHWDAYPDDAYRLSSVKHFFEDPLSTFDFTDGLAHRLQASVDAPKDLIAAVAAPLDIALPSYSILGHRLSSSEIFSRYNIRLERYSPSLRTALMELLSGITAADALILQARSVYTSAEMRFLQEQADSLLRESPDDKDATVVQMKLQEWRGDSISLEFLKLANRFPRELISEATAIILQSVNIARLQLERMSSSERDSVRTEIIHSAAGDIAIGGVGSDTYEGRYLCILDLGGDDVYRQPGSSKAAAYARSLSVILDAGGNDVYTGGDFAIASGWFGVSVLDDESGDDMYRAGSFGLGSGMFGAGVLMDRAGNDHYSGGTFVEGAGAFGFGLLIDKEGNDSYEAQLHSQGFGFTWGLGAIVELGGNDTYSAAGTFTDVLRYDDHFETLSQGCGLGIRPFASGGIGLIAEAKGNDTYICDIFGQGAGYWFALGGIVDDAGNDHYMAYQYAQGAGIHLAFGVLIDHDGTDYYNSHGVSMGCGHDIGFGGLLDLKGDDFYATEGLSLGGGNANAVSFFCDAAGDDAYTCKATNTFGYSDNRRGYGMIGLFLDLGGNDFYPTSKEKNNTTWTGSYFGAGIDVNIPDTAKIAKQARQHDDDSMRAVQDLASDIRTLYMQACTAPQKYQYLVEPARTALIARKQEAIPYLLSRMSSTSPRERLALTELLPKMGDDILKVIVDSVTSQDERTVNMTLFVLGKMADSAAAGEAQLLLASGNWRFRMNAAEQLGNMKNTRACDALRLTATKDTVDMVRMRAVASLGQLRDTAACEVMMAALHDTSQLVRNKSREAMDTLGDIIYDCAFDSYPESRGFTRSYLQEYLVKNMPEDRVGDELPDFLSSDDAHVRSLAIEVLERRKDKKDLKLIKKFVGEERDNALHERLSTLAASFKKKVTPKREPLPVSH